ncbi:hypothetical protein Ae168Ps1_0657c [Pseudonocardia sp. Ae168_Ps1]|nr:hypothetical protein Ae150APs1_0658c [Pseudonocardia sp. Ae150A_Ps1]OLL78251.1 hypothetical protein Ae168Ps1_0657c [Pseudonocardia sp. Ae168_Ps1]OLL87624.1 hypothetical protein Ae263Ps1_4679 [Pseudonocardia sp. Ae263_Ps1]OLL92347.1 hypothetical protein Ae356Ps1_2244c [Pseudonocardia sp. Ae356_Ps1]
MARAWWEGCHEGCRTPARSRAGSARHRHRLALLSSGSGCGPSLVITDREENRPHLSAWLPDP